jgi:DNA-directed RNA polymerase II subunit RPB1
LFLDPSAPKEENFTHYYLPVNVERIISTIKINKKVSEREKCKLNPIDVVHQVEILLKEVARITHSTENSMNLLTTHLRVALASKEVCVRHRLTPDTFKEATDEIIYKLKKSLSHPGEAVGAIAAQSMGEPTT